MSWYMDAVETAVRKRDMKVERVMFCPKSNDPIGRAIATVDLGWGHSLVT